MCNQSPISVLDYVVTKMMLLLKPIDFNIHKIKTIFLKKQFFPKVNQCMLQPHVFAIAAHECWCLQCNIANLKLSIKTLITK